MNVKQLIEILKQMPPEAEVRCIWDGEPRSEIVHTWLARNGVVMLADSNEVVYSEESRPPWANSDPRWRTD